MYIWLIALLVYFLYGSNGGVMVAVLGGLLVVIIILLVNLVLVVSGIFSGVIGYLRLTEGVSLAVYYCFLSA